MYVTITQDDGKSVERFGVTDLSTDDGQVKVWFGPNPPEEVDGPETIEGAVSSVVSERAFGPKWEAKEAIGQAAQDRSVVDVKVVATDAYPSVKNAAKDLKADDGFVDDFELVA